MNESINSRKTPNIIVFINIFALPLRETKKKNHPMHCAVDVHIPLIMDTFYLLLEQCMSKAIPSGEPRNDAIPLLFLMSKQMDSKRKYCRVFFQQRCVFMWWPGPCTCKIYESDTCLCQTETSSASVRIYKMQNKPRTVKTEIPNSIVI